MGWLSRLKMDIARRWVLQASPQDAAKFYAAKGWNRDQFVGDWDRTSRAAQYAVDDLVAVIDWLRHDGHFAQADRLRTIAGRLARSVPNCPRFGSWRNPLLYCNLARTWPNQLTIKESKQIMTDAKKREVIL